MELIDDRADSRASCTDARADGVDVFLRRADGDLRARACLAGNGLDLDEARRNLGNLELKEPLDKTRVRSRDDDLRASGGPADLYDVDADDIALVVAFALDLLGGGKHRVGAVVGVAAETDGHVAGVGRDAKHRAGENLMLFGRERVEDHAALCLADALDNDLLGGLGGDAAKVLRANIDIHEVSELGVLVDLPGSVERNFGCGREHVVDHLFLYVHLEIAVFYLDEHVIGIAFLVLFIRRDECLRDLVDHVLLRNAALFFELGQRRENFSVHVFCIPP